MYPIVFLSALSDPVVYFSRSPDIYSIWRKNIEKLQECLFSPLPYIVLLNTKSLSVHFDRLNLVV